MSKITLNNVGSLIDSTTAANTINANNSVVQTAFDNTLSRDGTSPNQMNSNLDMNSNQIINLPAPATTNSPLRLQDLNTFVGGGTISNIPAGGTTGQVLSKTSNTNYATGWTNSVTSVGLSLPADFTVTNSPVTTTGTLTGSWATTPTGTGAVVRATSPTLVTPALGTPASGVATNLTGTAAGLTAGTVTTNANLTGPITSVGNATSVAAQTGTGSTFVMNTSPTLVTPNLGTPSAATLTNATGLPISTGVSGLGTGVATALSVNTGTAGSFQAFDPQLFSNIPQNSQSAAYTLVLTDGEKHIFHPSADTTARIWTIPANASVAYPIGTAVTFVNQNAAGVITISITTDTLRLAGAGTTGNRTLAANGIATALKVTATEWIISGTGLT